MKTVTPILIYNLAELPKGKTLDDIIKHWKEDNIVIVDTFEHNNPDFLHSHIEHMTIESNYLDDGSRMEEK